MMFIKVLDCIMGGSVVVIVCIYNSVSFGPIFMNFKHNGPLGTD